MNAPATSSPAQPVFFQQNNQFFRESVPDAGKLARLRSDAPEMYEAFVAQFNKESEHNRDMQQRAITIDEKVIPQLPKNDRLGIYAAWTSTFMFGGIALYCITHGIEWGWIVLLVEGLAKLVSAFRARKAD